MNQPAKKGNGIDDPKQGAPGRPAEDLTEKIAALVAVGFSIAANIGHDMLPDESAAGWTKRVIKERDSAKAKLRELVDAVESALKLSDLWLPARPVEIDHLGEATALTAMHDKMLSALKAAKEE